MRYLQRVTGPFETSSACPPLYSGRITHRNVARNFGEKKFVKWHARTRSQVQRVSRVRKRLQSLAKNNISNILSGLNTTFGNSTHHILNIYISNRYNSRAFGLTVHIKWWERKKTKILIYRRALFIMHTRRWTMRVHCYWIIIELCDRCFSFIYLLRFQRSNP